ncbi:MAG: thioredoxin family protein [Bacteroidetes bacterium]|nr:MAG: thioredoxin family protein [Bacteroidota bacterium]
MAVETIPISLGFKAPDFSLLDTQSGEVKTLEELSSEKVTVVMFICNHCPYVIHVNEALIELAKDYQPKGVSFIAISSNDVENYPDDSPEKMKEMNYPFPYLYDESQQTAKDYSAVCTPDFSIFNSEMNCVYRGQLDGSRPGSDVLVSGEDLRAALDNILTGEPVAEIQHPSMGCSIKWKS